MRRTAAQPLRRSAAQCVVAMLRRLVDDDDMTYHQRRVAAASCPRLRADALTANVAVRLREPTIVTGALGGEAEAWAERWSRDAILSSYGDSTTFSGRLASGAKTLARGAVWRSMKLEGSGAPIVSLLNATGGAPLTLRQLIDANLDATLFGAPPDDAEIRHLIPAAARGFAADRDAAPLPPALRRFTDVFPVVPLKAALSLGVRGQWNDVHRHTTAVFTQVAGTKGWALWPPFTPRSTLDAAKLTSAAADETSRDTMCGLFGVGGGNVSALLRHRGLRLCELHAGEALVIPTFGERHRGGWWHGTCNLGEWTAGFTTFHFPPA